MRIKVKFSYRHVHSGAVLKALRTFYGESFHAIVDRVKRTLVDEKASFVKEQFPDADPGEWVINGFQDYSVWKDRKDRAARALAEDDS